jgi:hypothetical protein
MRHVTFAPVGHERMESFDRVRVCIEGFDQFVRKVEVVGRAPGFRPAAALLIASAKLSRMTGLKCMSAFDRFNIHTSRSPVGPLSVVKHSRPHANHVPCHCGRNTVDCSARIR